MHRDGKLTSQEIVIQDDKEKNPNMVSTLKKEVKREEPAVSIGSFLPDNALIKPRDIICKRWLTKEGGRIVFHVKYAHRGKET